MTTTVCFFNAVGRTGSHPTLLSFVRKALVLTVLLAISSVFPLRAQFFDASQAGGTVTITAPWRFNPGDNLQWASPSFDNSQWSLLSMDRPWNAQGYGGYSGYGWYRIRLQLPASKEPLALGIARGLNSAEIYADGKPIGVIGRMQPAPAWVSSLPNIAAIPLPTTLNGRTIDLAIRAWQPTLDASFLGRLSWPLPVLGTEQAIRGFHNLSVHRSLFAWLPDMFVALVAVVIGQISFGLFLLRPRATEYAWAGLALFGDALYRGFDLFRQAHELPVVGSVFVLLLIGTGSWVGWLFLVWRFMNAKVDGFFRAAIFLVLARPLDFVLANAGFISIPQDFVFTAVLQIFIGVLVFVRLVHEARRGNRDAQIFLIPFLLGSAASAGRWILNALYWSGLFWSEATLDSVVGWNYTGERILLSHGTSWDSSCLSWLSEQCWCGDLRALQSRSSGLQPKWNPPVRSRRSLCPAIFRASQASRSNLHTWPRLKWAATSIRS